MNEDQYTRYKIQAGHIQNTYSNYTAELIIVQTLHEAKSRKARQPAGCDIIILVRNPTCSKLIPAIGQNRPLHFASLLLLFFFYLSSSSFSSVFTFDGKLLQTNRQFITIWVFEALAALHIPRQIYRLGPLVENATYVADPISFVVSIIVMAGVRHSNFSCGFCASFGQTL